MQIWSIVSQQSLNDVSKLICSFACSAVQSYSVDENLSEYSNIYGVPEALKDPDAYLNHYLALLSLSEKWDTSFLSFYEESPVIDATVLAMLFKIVLIDWLAKAVSSQRSIRFKKYLFSDIYTWILSKIPVNFESLNWTLLWVDVSNCLCDLKRIDMIGQHSNCIFPSDLRYIVS